MTHPKEDGGQRPQQEMICVECGRSVPALYRVFSARNIQLLSCENCKKIVDPYVEHEFVIVALDALRLRLPVYRHLLWNMFSKSHSASYLKLLVAIIFFSTYARLYMLNPLEPFKDVWHNVVAFSVTLLELIAFTLGVYSSSRLLLIKKRRKAKFSYATRIWRFAAATIAGSSASVMFVTILIWSYESNFVTLLRLLLLASHFVATLALIEPLGGNIFVAAIAVTVGAAFRAAIRWRFSGAVIEFSLPLILSLFD